MFPMDPSAYSGIAFANPDAATALATAALVDVSNNHLLVSLIIGVGSILIGVAQVAVVWRGINEISKSTRIRAAEQDQRHTEAMTALHSLIRQSQPRTRRAVLRPSP